MAYHTIVTVLILIVIPQVAPWCSNTMDSSPFTFQYPHSNDTRTILQLNGYALVLECCVVSTAPSVNWTFKGKPISQYGNWFLLTQNGQVLESANDALIDGQLTEGLYTCEAWNGNASISSSFRIVLATTDDKCSQGPTVEVIRGYPPSDVYNVVPYSSIRLECAVLRYCNNAAPVSNIWWIKYYEPHTYDTELYTLYQYDDSEKDDATGDFITVTSKNLGKSTVLVNVTLTIRNVTYDDLHDVYKPDGYMYSACPPGANGSCNATKSRNYYRCVSVDPLSLNPLQKFLPRRANVRLHATGPPTPAPANISAPKPDQPSLEREGIIIGSVIGGSFVLIMLLALVFVAHEWHVKLYFKRFALQAQHWRGVKRANYTYDCYVACCFKDEQFVYDLLRKQLEERFDYRLCLPERDFAVGTAIPDQISHCVKNSEYFLAVISPTFWKTDWCNLAVDIALRTNTKVVAVMLQKTGEEVTPGSEQLTKALKSPGCSRISYKARFENQDSDELILKLRCAMPRLDPPSKY